MKVEVVEEHWHHGRRGAELFTEESKMCCLGFLGAACGLSTDDMYTIGEPSDLDMEYRLAYPQQLFDEVPQDYYKRVCKFTSGDPRSMLEDVLVAVNDEQYRTAFGNVRAKHLHMTEEEFEAKRRELIKEGFALMEVEAVFVEKEAGGG